MQTEKRKFVVRLSDPELANNLLVGVKARKLNALISDSINIPAGFVISASAFDEFLLANKLVEPLVNELSKVQSADSDKINQVSINIGKLFQIGRIPGEVESEIIRSYQLLSAQVNTPVVVRQSPLTIELDEINFDRSNSGYLNVVGEQNLLAAVRKVWMDLFTPAAIAHRLRTEYEGNLSQPVLVQRMLSVDTSGVIYNFDISTKSPGVSTVIANLGLSNKENLPWLAIKEESVSEDKLINTSSDLYLLKTHTGEVLKEIKNTQKFMLVKPGRELQQSPVEVKVSMLWQNKPKLEATQLQKFSSTLISIEQQFSGVLEVEWVQEASQLYITNIRQIPETELLSWPEVLWSKFEGIEKVEQSVQPATSNFDEVINPLPEKSAEEVTPANNVQELDLEKKQLLELLQKEEDDLELNEEDRESKAQSLLHMLPEVKTVTEVWSDINFSASEVKVFKNNLDGLGVFKFSELLKTIDPGADISKLGSTMSLQKKVCEHLALYLIALQPKPLFIALEKEYEVETQLQILSQLRNLYGHKNFWVVLPELKAVDEVGIWKKHLSVNGFRRTNLFQIYQQISQPIFFNYMSNLAEQGIDGFIIDLDSLVEQSYGAGNSPIEVDEQLKSFIMTGLKAKSKLNLPAIVTCKNEVYLQALLPDLLKVGVNGLFYSRSDIYDFKQNLAEIETQILTASLKKVKKVAKGAK